MQRFPRRTNPGVAFGVVRKKDRTDLPPTVYNTARGSPVVRRLKPGFGVRHALRQQDVADFLRLLPGWGRLSEGLD